MKPASGSNFACVLAELQDPLVELGALLESQLTDLGNLPPDVVGVPWSKGTDVAFLATNGVLALAQGNTPALDSTLGSLTGGDCGDICKCPGLDNVIEGNFLSKESEREFHLFLEVCLRRP